MSVNLEAMLKEAGASAASLIARTIYLAGRVGELEERLAVLEAENAELKKCKEKESP